MERIQSLLQQDKPPHSEKDTETSQQDNSQRPAIMETINIEHNISTDKLTTPSPAINKGDQTQATDLLTLIHANVCETEQWIYTLDPTEWPEQLSVGRDIPWSLKEQIHPAMVSLLTSSTIPLWAA